MKELLILGGGTGGTMMANRLARRLPGWRVTVVDRDDRHIYQPGLLFLPFDTSAPEALERSRRSLIAPEVRVVRAEIDRIDPDGREVWLAGGERLRWDLLVVATGSALAPEATEGLTGEGWRGSASDFYTVEGALALRAGLEALTEGVLAVGFVENPIKCPVAPLEFAFLADAYLRRRGRRDRVQIRYLTPLEGAFTKPRAAALLGDMMERRGIMVVPEFATSAVDGAKREVVAWDGRRERYDLLAMVPIHQGSAAIRRSGLGNDSGFLPTDPHTLQAKHHPTVFALGDCTDLPTSKAGSVAHFQSEVLEQNLIRAAVGQALDPAFDGHANCFIETGDGKALLIDFNYRTEPLPGRFPLPGVGPFTLLEESHVNHWGKLGFRWVYWNLLLKGADLPLDHRLVMAGKWS